MVSPAFTCRAGSRTVLPATLTRPSTIKAFSRDRDSSPTFARQDAVEALAGFLGIDGNRFDMPVGAHDASSSFGNASSELGITVFLLTSWPGIARSKNGVTSFAYVPAIHVLPASLL